MSKVLFSAKGIKKYFGATKALDGVDLEVKEGEVVGLIGENGAGKSTLLKIIVGVQGQDEGEMTMNGGVFAPKTPLEANKKGIGMVFQEQSLIVTLTVGQNIFFGRENNFRKMGLVNWKKMHSQANDALLDVGCKNISAKKKVIALNFATRQMVEIAKVVNIIKSSGAEKCLILLDEPTSVLNEEETQTLFKVVKELTAMGHGIIFVSHRLDEVLAISDRVFVYKDGQNAGNMDISEASEAKMYEMMVGRSTTTEYYKLDMQKKPSDEVVLAVKDLGLTGVFKNVSFELKKGEILGFCGVVGSGKEEICSVICGDDEPTTGDYIYKGNKVNFKSCYQALKNGILMIPKERLVEGIVDMLSVKENIALSNVNMLKKGPLVSMKLYNKQADDWIKKLRIKTPGKDSLLVQLSGGNQQKVVFARAMASECEVLILNHPTRGVDVGAKEEIYTLIREMVATGKSVILLGDTLDECIGLSNRVLILKDGLVTGEFDASVDAKPTQVEIVSLMM